ncbi:MAG: hypothetical protein JW874_12440 [Spirochaetales bacterium]|nr:hypothetical protein [Spirochaetales bacterium]
MKKLLFIGLFVIIAAAVFAGGKSETDAYVHPDTIVYIELTNPDAAMQATDTLLKELGLMSILGINSVKQELIGKIKGVNPEYIDFSRPVTFSMVSPDGANPNGLIMMIPLKDKKFFAEIEKSFTLGKDGDNDVIIRAGTYALAANDKRLIEGMPFKRPLDLRSLDRKSGHLFSLYVSAENLMKLPAMTEEGIMAGLASVPGMETNPALAPILRGFVNVIQQAKSITMYADIAGTEISSETTVEFLDGSKASDFISGLAAKDDLSGMLGLLPSGYLGTFVIQNDKESNHKLTAMMYDLFDQKVMTPQVKEALLDFDNKIVELTDGPVAAAFDFDYGKLLAMSMGPGMQQGGSMDIVDMMGLQIYSVVKSGDPAAYRKVYGDMINSSAYQTYLKMSIGSNYSVKTNYVRDQKVKGISVDRFDISMKTNQVSDQSKKQRQQIQKQTPDMNINLSMYIASNSGYIFIASGDKALNDLIKALGNSGKPVTPYNSVAAVNESFSAVPKNAFMATTFSPLMMINSMIGGLTGGLDLGLNTDIENPASAVGFIEMKDGALYAESRYEAAELKAIITIMGMFIKMAAPPANPQD